MDIGESDLGGQLADLSSDITGPHLTPEKKTDTFQDENIAASVEGPPPMDASSEEVYDSNDELSLENDDKVEVVDEWNLDIKENNNEINESKDEVPNDSPLQQNVSIENNNESTIIAENADHTNKQDYDDKTDINADDDKEPTLSENKQVDVDISDDILIDNDTSETTENMKLRLMDEIEDHIEDKCMNKISLNDDDKDSVNDGLMEDVNLDDDHSTAKVEPTEQKIENDFQTFNKEDSDNAAESNEVEAVKESLASPMLQISNPAPVATLGSVSEHGEFLNINVTSPHRVGDGISSYMAYKVKTTTNMQMFKKKDMSVSRRFSDFLGLRDKLNDKYTHAGRIVPSAPDKSVVGMTKVKISKDEDNADQSEFIEKRRAALERYLNRTAAHTVLRNDPNFREFLELGAELPKANQTSTLSGKSVMKMFSKMGDKVSNYTTKMEESDSWFEDKTNMIENLENQLRKLLNSAEALVDFRKSLAGSTYSVAKSITALGHAEEDSKLSAALDQLGEVFMNIQKVHDQNAKDDLFLLSEMIHDYLGLVAAIKDVLAERVKAWQHWQAVTKDLNKKRELKVKLDMTGKADKLAELKAQITDSERQVESAQDTFDKISATIKKEIEAFEMKKCDDFKVNLMEYLERMLKGEETIATQWERYLPEIKQAGA